MHVTSLFQSLLLDVLFELFDLDVSDKVRDTDDDDDDATVAAAFVDVAAFSIGITVVGEVGGTLETGAVVVVVDGGDGDTKAEGVGGEFPVNHCILQAGTRWFQLLTTRAC